MKTVQTALEHVARQDGGRLLAALISRFGDFELAEDCLQDAYAAALDAWSRQGLPVNPAGWLMTTARNRAIDRIRRGGTLQEKLAQLDPGRSHGSSDRDPPLPDAIPDERLKLIFTCCHPAIGVESQVALTLRTLGGLTTEEIARAFLLPTSTLAQRVVRAKRKISRAGIPFRVPEPQQLSQRLDAVMAVVYLIFNEGYHAGSGESPVRADLSQEAIRLGEVLVDLLDAEGLGAHLPEALGLLALMRLHDSRRPARLSPDGELVLLEDQDRTRWDNQMLRSGLDDLDRALAMNHIGPYQVQAAISAVHIRAKSYDDTDWPEIVALYTALDAMTPSPVVRLNRAVAIGMAHGPREGLKALDTLADEPSLEQYAPLYAARADLLRRAGQTDEAVGAYRRALELTENAIQARFFRQRLEELSLGRTPGRSEKGDPSI
jgi:RNA polymerase sigma-70 factor (ECF subfamily)